MLLVTAPLAFFTAVTIVLGECRAVFGLTRFVQRMRMLGACCQCALAWGVFISSKGSEQNLPDHAHLLPLLFSNTESQCRTVPCKVNPNP
ncbi:hypothetical protein BDR22DRAFT_871930, partial [Usnea florida]